MPPPYGAWAYAQILERHPNLAAAGFDVTSDDIPRFNCIAWAAGDTTNWWWPTNGGHWPPGCPRNESRPAFEAAFAGLGYSPCGLDASVEANTDKVAIYVGRDLRTKHMAIQLPDGRWSSKLGMAWDIEHHALSGLEDDVYGVVEMILRRPRTL